MPTQDLDDRYSRVLVLKGRFNDSLSDMLTEMHVKSLTLKTFNHAISSLSAFVTEFEDFLTHATSSIRDISKTYIKDILVSIENILKLCAMAWEAFELASKDLGTSLALPSGKYLFTSQAIFKTYDKDAAREIALTYARLNLPVSGFNYKKRMKFNQMKIHVPQTVVGSVLMLAGIALIFTLGLETGMQYFSSRILIALGAGLLIAGLTKDYVHTRLNINGATIAASGAVAIFLIIYFFNPASAPSYTPDSKASQNSPSIFASETEKQ